MLNYLPTIVAFLAALVGIGGTTWVPARPPLQRLTLRGWCTVLLAAVSLVAGILRVHRDGQELETSRKTRKAIEDFALLELHRTLNNFTNMLREFRAGPFAVLSTLDLPNAEKGLESVLADSSMESVFRHKDLRSSSLLRGPWHAYLRDEAWALTKALDEIGVQRERALEDETLLLMAEIRNDGYLEELRNYIATRVRQYEPTRSLPWEGTRDTCCCLLNVGYAVDADYRALLGKVGRLRHHVLEEKGLRVKLPALLERQVR